MNMQSKLLAAVVAIAISGVPAAVFARTMPASLGNPYNQNDTCFAVSTRGGIRNTCQGVLSFWVIPMPFDTSGSKTVKLTGNKVTANTILTCTMRSTNPSGALSTLATFDFSGQPTGWSTITRTVTMPSGNAAWLDCQVGGQNNAELEMVDYF